MILVVGATGLLGMRICERLKAEKVNALRSPGCELGHR